MIIVRPGFGQSPSNTNHRGRYFKEGKNWDYKFPDEQSDAAMIRDDYPDPVTESNSRLSLFIGKGLNGVYLEIDLPAGVNL